MKLNRHDWLAPIFACIIFLVCWQGVVLLFGMSPVVFPGPSKVAFALFNHFGQLLYHAGITLLESVLGFLLGGVVAIGLAVLFVFSRNTERALYPYAIAMKAIPLVALAPIVVAWFGGDLISKVILAAVISFFPILVNAVDGLKNTEPEALDLMKSFSASRWSIFAKLQWPGARPQIFAGLKIASSFSVVGAVVAEFVSAQSGIGFIIKSSSYYLDTDLTFAAIFVAALMGLIFFGVIVWSQSVFVSWRKPNGEPEDQTLSISNITKEN
jgi:NitT/TauT family transport system permease protein